MAPPAATCIASTSSYGSSSAPEAELREYQTRLEQKVEERTLALSIAKEAAETANRAKGTFLANMSQSFTRARLMNAIMGMTSLARAAPRTPSCAASETHRPGIQAPARADRGHPRSGAHRRRAFHPSPVDFTLDQVWKRPAQPGR